MINLKLPLLNIPVDELLEEREAKLREFIIRDYGVSALETLFQIRPSLNEYLHYMGVRKGLYIGPYSPDDLPKMRLNARDSTPSKDRYVKAAGFTHDIIGRPNRNGFLTGPYSLTINNFNNAYRVLDHGFRLVINGAMNQEFGYGFMTNVKAVDIIDKKDAINNYIVYDECGCEVTDLEARIAGSSKFRKNEPFLFDTRIVKSEYINNAGSFVIKGAGEEQEWDDFKERWVKKKGVQAVYKITNKQPLMFVNGKVVYLGNVNFGGTTPNINERVGVQGEFVYNTELVKHSVAGSMSLIKGDNYMTSKGHSHVLIRVPKKARPTDNMNYLTLPPETPNSTMYWPGSVIKPLTMYSMTEDINSKTASYLNGLAAYLYYVEGCNENLVDYIIMNNFWDLVLSPELLWTMIINQDDMIERFNNTCFKTGAALTGTLIDPNKKSPYSLSDYSILPSALNAFVDMPLPSAEININNGEKEIPAKITIGPSRMHYLKPCVNNCCINYKKYYPMDKFGLLRHKCKINE